MDTTTILPSRVEIIARLTAINDTPWNVQKFYPLIAAAADTERAGAGLPLLFELAIADASDGDPLAASLRMQVPARSRHSHGDTALSVDAARCVPEVAA